MEKNIHSWNRNLYDYIFRVLPPTITATITSLVSSKISVLAVLLLSGLVIKAQPEKKELTLNEAIQKAMEYNKNISVSQLDEKIALFNYKQTAAVFLPGISLSHTTMVRSGKKFAVAY